MEGVVCRSKHERGTKTESRCCRAPGPSSPAPARRARAGRRQGVFRFEGAWPPVASGAARNRSCKLSRRVERTASARLPGRLGIPPPTHDGHDSGASAGDNVTGVRSYSPLRQAERPPLPLAAQLGVAGRPARMRLPGAASSAGQRPSSVLASSVLATSVIRPLFLAAMVFGWFFFFFFVFVFLRGNIVGHPGIFRRCAPCPR